MRTPTHTIIEALTVLGRDLKSTDKLGNTACKAAAERLEEQQRTLRVIRTWAEFYRESPSEHAETLMQIRDKCDKVLD